MSKTKDGRPQRITATGSLADLHNDGTRGQFRSILEAQLCYKEQIFKEQRWSGVYNRDNQERRRVAAAWNTSQLVAAPGDGGAAAGMPPPPPPVSKIVVDVLGRTTLSLETVRPKSKSEMAQVKAQEKALLEQRRPMFVPTKPSASASASSFVPTSYRLDASAIDAATSGPHLGRTDYATLPRNSALLPTHRNLAAIIAATNFQRRSWPCLSVDRDNDALAASSAEIARKQQQRRAVQQNEFCDSDSDADENDVATASVSLARPEVREKMQKRLDQLVSAVATSRAERTKLESHVDEIESLLLRSRDENQQNQQQPEQQQQRKDSRGSGGDDDGNDRRRRRGSEAAEEQLRKLREWQQVHRYGAGGGGGNSNGERRSLRPVSARTRVEMKGPAEVRVCGWVPMRRPISAMQRAAF